MKYIRYSIFFLFLSLIILFSVHRPTLIDRSIGTLPVLHEGRIKPIDTLARHTLLQIQGRLRLFSNASPVEWFFSMMTSPTAYKSDPIILVEHPKLFDSIDPKYRKQKYRVSEAFLNDHFDLIQPFVSSAALLEKEQRTPFQQASYLLANRFQTFVSLRSQFFPFEENSQLKFWNQMLLLTQSMNKNQIQSSPDFESFLIYYDHLKKFPATTRLIFDGEWSTLAEGALDPSQSKKVLLSNYLLLSDAYSQRDLDLISRYSTIISDEFKAFDSTQFNLVRLEYIFNQSGPVTMGASQVCGFVKSDPSRATPNLQFHVSPVSTDILGVTPMHNFEGITPTVANIRPTSRGEISVISNDSRVYPKIKMNYLSTDEDRRVAAQGLKIVRKIMLETETFKKYEPEEYRPGVHITDDEELVKAGSDFTQTIFHPVGTCKMGNDDMAVVDDSLKVKGVQNLRVIDASIMPTITSGNTNAPTVMIAEKGSDFIKTEYNHRK